MRYICIIRQSTFASNYNTLQGLKNSRNNPENNPREKHRSQVLGGSPKSSKKNPSAINTLFSFQNRKLVVAVVKLDQMLALRLISCLMLGKASSKLKPTLLSRTKGVHVVLYRKCNP